MEQTTATGQPAPGLLKRSDGPWTRVVQGSILCPMSSPAEQRDTTIATLHRMAPDFLEVVYKPGCLLGTSALGEVAQVRRALMGAVPHAMLSLIPEDADFELGAIEVDHLARDREKGMLLAIAIVTRANMIEMMLKLYFSYYPWLHRILVTDNEKEARTWIEGQLREMRVKGA